jgi:2,3-dihydroxybenzoate-AMP ligase
MLDGFTPWPQQTAERYRAKGYWRGETLVDALAKSVREGGDRTALVHGERRYTYAELDRWSARTAAGLHNRGIAAGDRVLVQLPNSPEFVVVCFALFRIGALPVFVLPAHRLSEVTHLAAMTRAVAHVIPGVVRGFDYLALARQAREGSETLREIYVVDPELRAPDVVALADVDDDAVPSPVPDPGDVAFFLLSGGTTALPKLIPRTHEDYLYQARIAAEAAGAGRDDVYLATLPVEFNFTWGCPGVIGMLQAGGTVVFADAPTPERCFAAIERERVTLTSVVPSIALLWLEALEWMTPDLTSLRTLQIGSAKLYPEVAARIEPAFGARLQQVFGMAEGLLTFTRAGDPPEVVLHTQGRALSPDDEIRIVDENDADVPTGEIGELITRGPYTLRGYYLAPEHNTRAFTADGYYRSGDLARLTAEGNLVIEGRLKDVVIRGGDKVSAAEVEQHLVAHPAIAQAAVVAEPDEMLGERICAYLIAAPDLAGAEPPSLTELKQVLHQRGLAEFKLPDRIEFIERFPLTGLGKIDKKALAVRADSEVRA